MKPRASRGLRSKLAEPIPHDIHIICNARTSSSISTSTGVPDDSVHELLNQRWDSADLVDHSFNKVVSIALAAKLALCFLHHEILSVTYRDWNQKVERKDWPEACLHAAYLTRACSKAGEVTREMKERYIWSWSEHLSTGTERGAQQFLNTVGFLGYVFGNMFDLDPENLSQRTLRTRITTLPRTYSRLPLAPRGSQDIRPNLFALHRSAFVNESKRDSIRKGEYLGKSSILLTISSYWPNLSKKYPWIFPSLCGENVTEEGSIDPLSLTPEGHDELLDDEAKGDDEDINMSYEEDGPVADLASILEELLKNLEMDSHRRLSSSMSADVEDYGTATFLDLSSVCFPNLLITGEGKKTNMRSAAVQATVHMRQQRRTQPWLRFCLGLMATKDEMGLLRADGTGVEKFIFPKNLGHGVFESIRLSLGILLATDQELGQHPSFYLRSVTKFRPTIPSTPTNFPDIPHRLISREVNWIILQEEKLHGKHLFDRAPTVFYVKHLIEDRGSLVGRCTRVWCVYQEVFNSDPLFNRYRNVLPAGSCVMKGPYALKAYNADMSFEAYEQDVLVKIMDQHRTKPLDGVLLPTHVWHFGDILTLVRGLTQDNCPSTISLDRIKNSQEVFTVSALKRTLSQFETIEEFYGAIIGVLQGIESLEAIKIIHRDISFGNIILNKEIYCDTDRELEWIDVDGVDGKPSRVALLRRETVDIGTVGGLHDLDMATYIPETVFIKRLEWPHASIQTQNVTSSKPVSTVQQELVRESRIGTVPFMSIPLLLGGQNSVYSDLQSLFFVLYLSMFTFEQSPCRFPNATPPLVYRWPWGCLDWARSNQSMTSLGSSKSLFFLSYSGPWYRTVKTDALPLWSTTRNKTLKRIHWDMLASFHEQLWIYMENIGVHISTPFRDNEEVRPSSIRAVLQKILESLDMDSEIPA